MMGFFDFANGNPFTAFLMIWAAACVLIAPFKYGYRAYARRLRAQNIAAKGWPPPPLDADGDVVYPET